MQMKQIDLQKIKNVDIGQNINIYCNELEISDGVQIGDGVSITAERIKIGAGTKIQHGVTVKALNGLMSEFRVGDNCLIGFNNQILVPHFSMLDYSQLHNSGLHSGYQPLTIGYNCWIGQNSILNSTERLTIGDNVRIGTQSQLWTHVASGELLEGCTLFGSAPLTLKDNVWIVGGAVISPGLVLEESSIIMTGAVLTKSTKPKHTYAGVPATDVTEKLNFWKDVSLEEKMKMLHLFVDEFLEKHAEYAGRVFITNDIMGFDERSEFLIISDRDFNPQDVNQSLNSYFNVPTKKYTKRRTAIEVDWIKFTVGFRARFTPYETSDGP